MRSETVSLLIGLVFLVLGVVPLLNHYGYLPFSLPVFPEMVYNILFIIGGLLLLVDWFRLRGVRNVDI